MKGSMRLTCKTCGGAFYSPKYHRYCVEHGGDSEWWIDAIVGAICGLTLAVVLNMIWRLV